MLATSVVVCTEVGSAVAWWNVVAATTYVPASVASSNQQQKGRERMVTVWPRTRWSHALWGGERVTSCCAVAWMPLQASWSLWCNQVAMSTWYDLLACTSHVGELGTTRSQTLPSSNEREFGNKTLRT